MVHEQFCDARTRKRKQLIQLIRRVAQETAYEVLDEHLTDFKHEEQPA